MKRLLVAGCGYVGTELARRMVARGEYAVIGLRRRAFEVPGVTTIACDLGEPAAITTALATVPSLDAVVYAVGADAHTEEAYDAAYVRGLANLTDALTARADIPSRLVLVSSTAVYAQDDGQWVDDRSPTEPTEFSGRVLLRSEALARSFDESSIVVRFGGIYGPGRTRFVDSVRSGTIRLAGGVEFTNRVHRDDCAEILCHLLALPAPAPLYLGVDDEPADRRAVAEWMAERLGVVLAPVPCTGAPPRGKRCSNRRLRDSGYSFLFPTFREGYGLAMPTLGD